MEPLVIDIMKETRDVINHEAHALLQLSEHVGQNYLEAVKLIHQSSGMVIVVGMGKSGIIGRKIAATLSSLGTPAAFMHAAEALHGDLGMIKANDVLLMISNSGNTRELIEIIPYARRIGSKIIAMTHNENSDLAKNCDVLLPLIYEAEACPLNLAPTTSSTMSLVIGDAIAVALTKIKNFMPKDFAMLHPGGSLGRRLLTKVSDIMHSGEELPLISGDILLIEALSIMTKKKFGTLIIAGIDNNLEGIITDGDLRRILCKHNGNIEKIMVREAMVRNPKRIEADKLCEEAINIMETKKITTLPVVASNDLKVIGIIHMHDLLKAKIY